MDPFDRHRRSGRTRRSLARRAQETWGRTARPGGIAAALGPPPCRRCPPERPPPGRCAPRRRGPVVQARRRWCPSGDRAPAAPAGAAGGVGRPARRSGEEGAPAYRHDRPPPARGDTKVDALGAPAVPSPAGLVAAVPAAGVAARPNLVRVAQWVALPKQRGAGGRKRRPTPPVGSEEPRVPGGSLPRPKHSRRQLHPAEQPRAVVEVLVPLPQRRLGRGAQRRHLVRQ